MQESEFSPHTLRRMSALATAFGLVLSLAVVAAVVWLGSYQYQEVLESDRVRSALEARVIEDHATRAVETSSLVLTYISGQLNAPDMAQHHKADPLLAQALAALPFVRSLHLLDGKGHVLASTAASDVGLAIPLDRLGALPAPGREALGGYRPGRGLSALAATSASSASGIGFIPFIRSSRTSDGNVLLLVALINPDFLSSFQLLTLGEQQDSVYLLSYQGEVLVSSGPRSVSPGTVFEEHPVFRKFLPATEHFTYQGDGASPGAQVVSFRLSKSRPLVVVVEQPLSATRDHWFTSVRWFIAAAVVSVLFVVLMTVGIRRSLRARELGLVALLSARAEVARKEDDLHVLVKSVQELLFRTDPTGVLTYVNERWVNMTGHSVEQAENHALTEWVCEADRAGISQLFDLENTAPVRTQTASMRASDGSLHRFDVAVVPLWEGDQIIGFAGSAVDVTERLAAESALQHQLDFVAFLLEISPLPVATFDRWGRFVSVNRAWEDFTGLSRERVMGQPGKAFMGAADAAFHAEKDAQVWRSGGTLRYESTIRHRDGSLREVIITKVVLPGDDQHANGGLLSTMMDVSEFRAAERAKDAARHAAEESSRTKSDFIANISHELRTPLQSILGFSELGMMRGKEQPRIMGMFTDIHAAGARMLALVNDLLDVSKIASTLGAVNLERTDIRGLIGPVLQELTPQIHAKSLAVDAQLGPAPLIAKVDPVRFAQVVRNVVANAIKFAPAQTGIEVLAYLTGDDHICISVRDHGAGIPAAELDRIFEAFVQSSRTQDGSGGTGLGLAICKTIMEAHGGRITADNAADGGAIFRIYLPARRSAQRETDFQTLY
ncbi:ATP-binding protein [Rhodoferax sp.]|uniref:ATP-binding protein n=1 Tax=Rhodoferax sp. TaxID=50421 RepID=UPI002ACDE0F1|nr:ATP-binding protein [Rhodoferax sp.]MDZ7921781.1 ATP-binding protein [Rhodoferax sp.]